MQMKKLEHQTNANVAVTIEDVPMQSNTDFLDLNDDCIFEIFKLFNPLDLVSVADTCTRFQAVARELVVKERKNINLYIFIDRDIERHLWHKRVVRHFGDPLEYVHNFLLCFQC